MSKFFCSNISENISKVVSHNSKFPVNETIDESGMTAVVFDKRAAHHTDYKRFSVGGVFLVGTPLLREGLTSQSLCRYVYEHTSEEKIAQLKADVVGYWAALVIKDGSVYVFNDYYGIYDICYTTENGIYNIGCDLADVARCVGKKLELDEFPFVMENFQVSAFPGYTSFKNICKVRSDNFLKIEGGELKIKKIEKVKIDYHYMNETNAINDITSWIKTYAGLIAEKYAPMSINMTGGLDSRLMFAAFNAVGANISFMHGVHSGGQAEDGVIVKQLSESYGKTLELVDWEQPKSFNLKDQEDVFEEIGFNNYLAAGCKKHIDEFFEEAKRYPFTQSGYFCEAIRLREWAEKKGRTFSLYDYVDDYFIDKNLKSSYQHYNAYRDYLVEGLKRQLVEIGYMGDVERIPVNLFERFRWQMSRYHDSRSVVNENKNRFTFSLLAVPYIHEAILSLPSDVIRGGTFQIKVIERLDPNLMKFDVFSHRRAFYIKNYRKVHKLTKKNLADFILGNMPALKKTAVKIYQRLKYDSANKRNLMAEQIHELYEDLPNYINIDTYQGSLVRLRALAIGLHCIAKEK